MIAIWTSIVKWKLFCFCHHPHLLFVKCGSRNIIFKISLIIRWNSSHKSLGKTVNINLKKVQLACFWTTPSYKKILSWYARFGMNIQKSLIFPKYYTSSFFAYVYVITLTCSISQTFTRDLVMSCSWYHFRFFTDVQNVGSWYSLF